MTVSVQFKGRNVDVESIGADATVGQLKASLAKKTGLSTTRQSIKCGNRRYADDHATLKSLGWRDETLQLKDLGAQIGYRTVFVIEYAGPIVIMLMYAMQPWAKDKRGKGLNNYEPVAVLGIVCWLAHFVKRELETFFVHRFSRPTMPLFQLWTNCWYYYAFSLGIGYFLCSTKYTPPAHVLQVRLGLALFVISELLNFAAHMRLRMLRPADGSKERPIPSGFPCFDLVCCPNYLFEILSWVGFSVMTGITFSFVFTVVGAMQMYQWAVAKDATYKKNYENYKKLNRKALIPFLL